MNNINLGSLKTELNKKYDVDILDIKDNDDGSVSFFLDKDKVSPSFLGDAKLNDDKAVGSVVNRTALDRSYLDLSSKKSIISQDIHNVYKKSMEYYYLDPIYGASINTLSNFACKGFENDCNDSDIKHFFDSWCFDINFDQILEWMFFDLFRIGMVRTYKIIGKYEPGINYFVNPATKASKENAAAKKKWSKKNIPVRYTVLNPEFVELKGSLLFGDAQVTLKPNKELKDLLNKPAGELTDEEKNLIRKLPSKFKSSVKAGDNIVLDPALVGAVDYRKMPYERYAYPRGCRVFESLNYKKALRDADLSTLDGITNYILKITVGNDSFPVTSQTQLEQVAQLFNTPSKSFDVVYNHTLKIEKIVSPEIENVLGRRKYEQVNEDISCGLGMPRTLLDGGLGGLGTSEINTVVKSVVEEIGYARKMITRWIYKEYVEIATAMGFESIPKVRWDDTILKDILMYMSIIGQLVDRRMLSYETALEKLGFDFPNELSNMREELPIVLEEGAFGILGSPWQQAAGLAYSQDTQNAPEGTPSYGKPVGQPSVEDDDRTGEDNKGSDSGSVSDAELFDEVSGMDGEMKDKLFKLLTTYRGNN